LETETLPFFIALAGDTEPHRGASGKHSARLRIPQVAPDGNRKMKDEGGRMKAEG